MKNEESTNKNRVRAEMLSEALGEVKGDYVTEADPGFRVDMKRTETEEHSRFEGSKNVKEYGNAKAGNSGKTKKHAGMIPILLFAAGFLLVSGLGIGALLHSELLSFGKNPSGGKETGEEEKCYVDYVPGKEMTRELPYEALEPEKERLVSFVTGKEMARELPYEALETEEQYLSLSFSGKGFRSRCNLVGEGLLTETLGSGVLFFGETREESEIRKIGNIDPELLVAAKLPKEAGWGVYLRDDLWEVMHLDADEPEDTFGDLMERADLEKTLNLRVCYVKNESECRALEEGTAEKIFQILKEAERSPRIENLAYERNIVYFDQKRVISFAITSEELGIKNRAFTLREGGVLEMNILDYALYYDIGEDTVKAILSEALDHSSVITEDPEGLHYLAGRITKAEAGELVLDDTDLCLEGVEGREYRFSGDLGRKYEWLISNGDLKVGDLICVSFFGPKEQNEDGTWLIKARIEDISEVSLGSDGEVMMKE